MTLTTRVLRHAGSFLPLLPVTAQAYTRTRDVRTTDTFAFLNASSGGLGSLTVSYDVVAANAGLALAGPLANLADVTILTNLTSANPGSITSKLDPALQNSDVADYIVAGKFRLTPTEVLPATEAVVPTSSPTVAVNFNPDGILIELVIKSSGAPLNITAADCTFNNPAGACIGGANDLEICDPELAGGGSGGPGEADCTEIKPPFVTVPGVCTPTDGTDISFDVVP